MWTYLITIIILRFVPTQPGVTQGCEANFQTARDSVQYTFPGCRPCAVGCYSGMLPQVQKLQPECGGEPFRLIQSIKLDSIPTQP